MSLLLKLGLVGVTAGVGGIAALSHLTGIHGRTGFEMHSLASLSALVGIGASAAGTVGPIDKTFTVRRVHFDGMAAKVELITVPQPGPVRLQANGTPDRMKELQVRAVGDELFLRLDSDSDDDQAWFPWNLFNMWSKDRRIQDLTVRVTAPVGTPYEMEGMIGTVAAGDLDAPLRFEGHSVDARFGNTLSAQITIKGSGDITLGAVKETLDLEVKGSGDFKAASAAAAQIQIMGGGDVTLGPIGGSLGVQIKGSGDVGVARVNGPVDLKIRGAGDVKINGGRADPFSVEISGAGDVRVDSYSGRLQQSISGAGSFEGVNQQPPAAANVTGQ